MLRVTIEEVRFGNEKDKKTLSIVEIVNITQQIFEPGKGIANYLIRKDGQEIGVLRKFNRANGAIALVARALQMIEAQKGANSENP